ncbi:MAG: type II secretion system major pseudopilin GspG [Planctomycetes bacterium]|nr:type II secretion system major pseudopilin GspG [Planctomycetota bacterium]
MSYSQLPHADSAPRSDNENPDRLARPGQTASTCPNPRRFRRGFSLVEIMIVVVIIGLLAGVVSINVRSYLTKAKQNTARQEIATIVTALETFYATYSRYPSNDEGLTVLTEPGEKIPEPLLTGKPKDPWGLLYQYNSPGSDNSPYEVICYGADGHEGGDGANADINSHELKE